MQAVVVAVVVLQTGAGGTLGPVEADPCSSLALAITRIKVLFYSCSSHFLTRFPSLLALQLHKEHLLAQESVREPDTAEVLRVPWLALYPIPEDGENFRTASTT